MRPTPLLPTILLTILIPSATAASLFTDTPELNCVRDHPSAQTRATIAQLQNCAIALTKLPIGVESGIFHNHGRPDAFQLPKSAAHDDCQVTVNINYPECPVRATWVDVWTLANTLSMACSGRSNRLSQIEYAFTGGTLRVGSLDVGPIEGFTIRMRRTPPPRLGMGSVNGSVVETA